MSCCSRLSPAHNTPLITKEALSHPYSCLSHPHSCLFHPHSCLFHPHSCLFHSPAVSDPHSLSHHTPACLTITLPVSPYFCLSHHTPACLTTYASSSLFQPLAVCFCCTYQSNPPSFQPQATYCPRANGLTCLLPLHLLISLLYQSHQIGRAHV